MRLWATLITAASLVSFALGSTHNHRGFKSLNWAESKRAALIEKRTPNQPFQNERLEKRSHKFLSARTKKFAVNGTGVPQVPFDIGESYAGLIPISGAKDETRELFFWFFPSTNSDPGEEITIWFTGGPGCSSLSGLLTENGPFTWEAGTLAPVQNPYTWVNLTNMLWVEQPIGVGYTQGTPNITNEVELGQEFIGFYEQFAKTFDVKGWDVYITGESYGGYYVPYVADTFVRANSSAMPLRGIAFNDPIIGDGVLQQGVTIQPYIEYWQNLLYLNHTTRTEIKQLANDCGFTHYFDKYLQFPPPQGKFPPANYSDDCDILDAAFGAVLEVNPCFNIYHITETCPHPYGVLGIINDGDYVPPGAETYFNRTDVKKALHAPLDVNWLQCNGPVFLGDGDTSLGPAVDGTLQRVIEHTNNVIIGSGNLDFLLNTNGTLLALQNVTWNGHQGLRHYPGKPFYTPYHPEYNGGALAGAGILGTYGTERGLTFYQVQLSGHELPGYAPGAAYRSIELMLGKIKSLGQRGDFTTQSGNFTE